MLEDAKLNNDEDLLILSDEGSESNGLSIEGDITPIDDNSAISNDDNSVVLFDTTIEDAPKNQDVEVVHEENHDNSEDNFTLTFDASDDNESEDANVSEVMHTESLEQNSSDSTNGFNFDLGTGSSSSSDETESMENILAGTIEKFQKRAEKIEGDIIRVDEEVKDLKSQIEELEKQVKEKDEEKVKLSSEKTAIEKNIKSLEKMKADSGSLKEIA